MGVLRKIGLAIVTYIVIGVILYFLFINDIIIYNNGNMLIDILHTIFNPVILATNFIFVTLPF